MDMNKEFKFNLQEVLNALEVPYIVVKPLFDANSICYLITGKGHTQMWLDQEGHDAIESFVTNIKIFQMPTNNEVIATIEADQVILSALIDRALATGNKEEFMRLTSVYKMEVN